MSKRYERGSKMEEKRKINWVPRKRSHSRQIWRIQSRFEGDVRGCSEISSDLEVQAGRHAAETGRALRTS